jgi:hypothetical protein
MQPMHMHEVIGRGAAVIRRRKGWTQEQAARARQMLAEISDYLRRHRVPPRADES